MYPHYLHYDYLSAEYTDNVKRLLMLSQLEGELAVRDLGYYELRDRVDVLSTENDRLRRALEGRNGEKHGHSSLVSNREGSGYKDRAILKVEEALRKKNGVYQPNFGSG
jgi:hypothetical protein